MKLRTASLTLIMSPETSIIYNKATTTLNKDYDGIVQ